MLRPDDVLENYRVVRHLGGGSSAEVFEVEHVTLGSRHALKVLNRQWVEDAELRGRFLAEGRLLASLRSDQLVRVTDTLASPGVAALVMDLLVGETLRDRLEREGALPVDDALRIVRALLEGLAVAHLAGVVHRDVKPENVFLESDGGVRLIDFGIAKGLTGDRTTQRAMGTCAYMSPEQVRNTAGVDARSDLFAVGAILWETLTGAPAFEGPTAFASMEAVLAGVVAAPSSIRSEVPAWLDGVVAHALAVAPNDRIQSAAAFLEDLQTPRTTNVPVVGEAVALAESPVADAPVADAPPARRRGSIGPQVLLALVLGVFALCLLAVGTVGTLAYVYRPASVKRLSVESTDCGDLSITADVRARDADLTLTVDGLPVLTDHVAGQRVVEAVAKARRGTVVDVVLVVGGRQRSIEHRVAGVEPALTLSLPVDSGDPVRATLTGSCMPAKLRYEGRVAGKVVEGAVGPDETLTFDLGELAPGRHGVELRILDDKGIVTMANSVLFAGSQPNSDDRDDDGVPAFRDCNDLDPTVGPNQEERDYPNGVDDDCDGLVDEGTEAYDDDRDGLSERDGDCDDADPDVRPGRPELPDCRDQNCNGAIDEGVERPAVDDLYEPNGTVDQALDLGTDDANSFTRDLDLVFADADDTAWFRFHSDDGTFDAWGIDIVGTRLPADSVFEVEVVPEHDGGRGTARMRHGSDPLRISGRALVSDSGTYLLRIDPVTLPRPWCPARWTVRSR